MKQKDFLLIGVIVFISVIISYIVSNTIFGSPKSRQQPYTVVQVVTTDFPAADTHYFNKDAFDPTQPISITQNANSDPFKDTTQH